MLFGIVLALTTIGFIAFMLARERREGPTSGWQAGTLPGPDWSLLLLPVAMAAAVMAGGAHGLIPAELGFAALAIIFAPRLAASWCPTAYSGWPSSGYCCIAETTATGTPAASSTCSSRAIRARRRPVLAEAAVLFEVGLWLLLRLDAPGAGLVRAGGSAAYRSSRPDLGRLRAAADPGRGTEHAAAARAR